MFIITPEFKFLDVINYLGPGTSYDKWVKAYGCKQTKSWFPYKWFDSPDKLASRSSRLPGMVFATESRVPTDAVRMESLQTNLPREWNDVIR